MTNHLFKHGKPQTT